MILSHHTLVYLQTVWSTVIDPSSIISSLQIKNWLSLNSYKHPTPSPRSPVPLSSTPPHFSSSTTFFQVTSSVRSHLHDLNLVFLSRRRFLLCLLFFIRTTLFSYLFVEDEKQYYIRSRLKIFPSFLPQLPNSCHTFQTSFVPIYFTIG